jgi:hypothetical protein
MGVHSVLITTTSMGRSNIILCPSENAALQRFQHLFNHQISLSYTPNCRDTFCLVVVIHTEASQDLAWACVREGLKSLGPSSEDSELHRLSDLDDDCNANPNQHVSSQVSTTSVLPDMILLTLRIIHGILRDAKLI